MKAEVRAKWVAALRSGAYRQGRHALRYKENDGELAYCCLGVLCDISGQAEWVKSPKADLSAYGDSAVILGLPDSVVIWAGLDTHSPFVETRDGPRELATLNDLGANFSEIAGLIETRL